MSIQTLRTTLRGLGLRWPLVQRHLHTPEGILTSPPADPGLPGTEGPAAQGKGMRLGQLVRGARKLKGEGQRQPGQIWAESKQQRQMDGPR